MPQLKGTLTIEFQDDGSIKLNSTKLEGSSAEIEKELEALAKELGGEFKVEKHVPGLHHHHHGHSHVHGTGR